MCARHSPLSLHTLLCFQVRSRGVRAPFALGTPRSRLVEAQRRTGPPQLPRQFGERTYIVRMRAYIARF